jgi:hypothetical protein
MITPKSLSHSLFIVMKICSTFFTRKIISKLCIILNIEKRTEIDTQYTDAECLQQQELDPRVVEMYQEVGEILAKYRSGKVPKAFKIIAQFHNWEDLLILTKPENCSVAAVHR